MEEHIEKTAENNKTSRRDSSLTVGKLFWGLLLILIGGLLLAQNFGLANVSWFNLWKLFPLFIIVIGLSVMSINHIIWRIFMVLAMLAMLGFAACVMLIGFPNEAVTKPHEATVAVASDSVKKLVLNVKAGAGNINIDSSVGQKAAVEANLDSGFAGISQSSAVVGETQTVNLAMDVEKKFQSNFGKNDFDISLGREIDTTLNIDAGATKTDIDTSFVNLSAMNIKIGASSLYVKLGNKQTVSNISLESGASSIVLNIPNDCGVKLNIESGLTSKQFSDLKEVSDGIFESTNYNSFSKKINITAKLGVASINIERY